MSKYQLWSRDEYGQGSILSTSEDIKDIVNQAKKEVTNLNVNNALTSDDRERNWEAYFVEIESNEEDTEYVYAGITASSKNSVYKVASEEVSTIKIDEIPEPVIKIYLGNISVDRKVEKDWYAVDNNKRKVIDKLDHQDLIGKTIFFVKKL